MFCKKRFAAKEALFKAIGLKNKLEFQDVEVKNSYTGSPSFNIKTFIENLKNF